MRTREIYNVERRKEWRQRQKKFGIEKEKGRKKRRKDEAISTKIKAVREYASALENWG